MAQKREGYAPFSVERKAGVQSATVNGTIDVVQEIRPTLTTGFVDEKGDWKGLKSSEEQFHSFGVDEAIANGAAILAPQIASGTIWPLDMTGFKDIQIAIRPSNGGNFKMEAVMGPADLAYANLRDVNAAATLKLSTTSRVADTSLDDLFYDAAEALTADVWNIFMIMGRTAGQKLLQFKITNNSGDISSFQFASLRVV